MHDVLDIRRNRFGVPLEGYLEDVPLAAGRNLIVVPRQIDNFVPRVCRQGLHPVRYAGKPRLQFCRHVQRSAAGVQEVAEVAGLTEERIEQFVQQIEIQSLGRHQALHLDIPNGPRGWQPMGTKLKLLEDRRDERIHRLSENGQVALERAV